MEERGGQLLSFSRTWRPECEQSVAKVTSNNSSSVTWVLSCVGVVLATIDHCWALCCGFVAKKKNRKKKRNDKKSEKDKSAKSYKEISKGNKNGTATKQKMKRQRSKKDKQCAEGENRLKRGAKKQRKRKEEKRENTKK